MNLISQVYKINILRRAKNENNSCSAHLFVFMLFQVFIRAWHKIRVTQSSALISLCVSKTVYQTKPSAHERFPLLLNVLPIPISSFDIAFSCINFQFYHPSPFPKQVASAKPKRFTQNTFIIFYVVYERDFYLFHQISSVRTLAFWDR